MQHRNLLLLSHHPSPWISFVNYESARYFWYDDAFSVFSSFKANGFLNSRGFSGYIPMAYRESLIKLLGRFGSLTSQLTWPTVLEYSRPSWTFHAKGIWFEQGEKCDQTTSQPHTSFTLIGSSNFSYRSLNRDLESQVAIWTTDPHLRAQILAERSNLFNATYVEQVFLSQLVTQTQYRLPWYLRFLHPILHRFM